MLALLYRDDRLILGEAENKACLLHGTVCVLL